MPGGVGGTAVGLVQYKSAGIVGGLQDIESKVARFADRGKMIGAGGVDEVFDMFPFHMNLNQAYVHSHPSPPMNGVTLEIAGRLYHGRMESIFIVNRMKFNLKARGDSKPTRFQRLSPWRS
jgi:hypothetical protein